MVVLCILAPNGMQSVKGDNAAAAVLVFLMIAVAMILLVVFGRNEPGRSSSISYTEPVPLTGSLSPSLLDPARPPAKPVVGPALAAFLRSIGRALAFRWIARLPDWLQPILWRWSSAPLRLRSCSAGDSMPRWRVTSPSACVLSRPAALWAD